MSCNTGYKLVDGYCIVNYSIKIIYNTDTINQNIKLINEFQGKITEMIIDEKNVEPCTDYTFENIGNHTVYMLVDTENTTSLDYMFYKVDKMISISFTENFKTDNIVSMNNMFSVCSSLTSINLANFNTKNVKDMSYMFVGCTYLSSFNFFDINIENVINMTAFFYGCVSLTSIDLSKIINVLHYLP